MVENSQKKPKKKTYPVDTEIERISDVQKTSRTSTG